MPKGVYVRKKGMKGNNWKGGISMASGYRRIWQPDHPRANPNYVFEHIVIAERVLGKPLPPGAEVHHHGERNDNTQIVICQDRAYHFLLHQRMRALKACGHASWRKCVFCTQYDKPENLHINGDYRYHKHCARRYSREKNHGTKRIFTRGKPK